MVRLNRTLRIGGPANQGRGSRSVAPLDPASVHSRRHHHDRSIRRASLSGPRSRPPRERRSKVRESAIADEEVRHVSDTARECD